MPESDTPASEAARVRSRLGYPVVDADGHIVESLPVLIETIRGLAGSGVADRLAGTSKTFASRSGTPGEKVAKEGMAPVEGQPIEPWWALPTNTLDRATGFLPRLLHERLDELGIDFSILYPSVGLACVGSPDDALRRASARAINLYLAESLDGLGDRLTAAAVIPTHTPEEAIEELEYAIETLGFRAAMFNSFVERPLPAGSRRSHWVDLLALDSPYDYDPLWQRCVDLGVAVTVHSSSQGIGLRQSSSRYMFNHIGNFAASSEAFAKALFFGGVLKRFPTLHFGFLECGVGWGAQLLNDLIDRWKKRGGKNIDELDPARADADHWDTLMQRYGGKTFAAPEMRRATWGQSDNPPLERDDFREAGVEGPEDIAACFDRFFFGCEADDCSVPQAFARATNPAGTALQPVFGSDLGHWDVRDMTEILPEAAELLDDGLVSADDFRRFVNENPIRLHAGMNPRFFEGTCVEAEAHTIMASRR
ncbi:MAG: amidohydrolase family protein [Deltaproteobacteria bacterium]|jgi:predicted TIM-barrel fold metal-dependent hydrolase|nr:amidohydrolase family protein [Deltaproteobacteria bacterium]